MAQTLPDITANNDDWVSVNTLTSIAVGEYFTITNKSNRRVVINESVTKPATDSTDGLVLTSTNRAEPSGIVPAGSLEIWAKGLGGKAKLSVQTSSVITSAVIPLEVSSRGSRGVPTFVQDQTTNPLSVPLLKSRVMTNLAVNGVIGDTNVTLAPAHGAVVGDILELADLVTLDLFMQATILNVVADVITIDQPLNHAYLTTDTAVISEKTMLVNGSLTSPIIYSILPLPTQAGDILKIILDIRATADMDFSSFGGAAALTNGCVVRVKQENGDFRNLFNFKTNGDFIQQGFDHQFLIPKGGNTTRGFTSKITWGGSGNHGVAIRLEGSKGEELQVLIQDDLTIGNTVFTMTAQGHETQE